VAAHKLLQGGSAADVIILVPFSAHTKEQRPPPTRVQCLTKSQQMQLVYIPKFASPELELETFYSLTLETFCILTWIEYIQVMFLDSDDVMPLCSLDYLLELSEPKEYINATLQENIYCHGKYPCPSEWWTIICVDTPGGRLSTLLVVVVQSGGRHLFAEKSAGMSGTLAGRRTTRG
jgi:hypothetical protein